MDALIRLFLDWRLWIWAGVLLPVTVLVPAGITLAFWDLCHGAGCAGLDNLLLVAFFASPILLTSLRTNVWRPWRSEESVNTWMNGLLALCGSGSFLAMVCGIGFLAFGAIATDGRFSGAGLMFLWLCTVFISTFIVCALIAFIGRIVGERMHA